MAHDTDSWDTDPQMLSIPNVLLQQDRPSNIPAASDMQWQSDSVDAVSLCAPLHDPRVATDEAEGTYYTDLTLTNMHPPNLVLYDMQSS